MRWVPVLLVCAMVAVITCGPPSPGAPAPKPVVTPPHPERAFCVECMQFEPPAFYLRWWKNVEQCSGFTGKLSIIRWYLAPRPYLRWNAQGDSVMLAAYMREETPVIVLGLFREADSTVVEHEMLHALLDQNDAPRDDHGHPSWEKTRCGALIGNW